MNAAGRSETTATWRDGMNSDVFGLVRRVAEYAVALGERILGLKMRGGAARHRLSRRAIF